MHQTSRVLLFSVVTVAAGAAVAGAQAKSGIYGNLTLGIDGTTVTGAFSDARPGNGTEDAPQFSCIFALRGTLTNGSGPVTVWMPPNKATTSGTISIADGSFKLRLQGDPPGCGATGDHFVSAPFEDSSVKDGAWTSVRLVSAANADMHEAPLDVSPRKTSLPKGDVVVIYRRIGVWLEAESFGGKHPSRGWMRESDLAPDQP